MKASRNQSDSHSTFDFLTFIRPFGARRHFGHLSTFPIPAVVSTVLVLLGFESLVVAAPEKVCRGAAQFVRTNYESLESTGCIAIAEHQGEPHPLPGPSLSISLPFGALSALLAGSLASNISRHASQARTAASARPRSSQRVRPAFQTSSPRPQCDSFLRQPIDLVVVRENSEGEYVDSGGTLATDTPDEVAIQSAVHTRRGIDRILRFAFHLARTRSRRLALITKSNAQRHA